MTSNNYIINFVDPTKSPIKVPANINIGPSSGVRQTDIDLIGMGHSLWGETILENFLHMLENFSCREDLHNIISIDINGQFFKISGDVTKSFILNGSFEIINSAGSPNNDGTYIVSTTPSFNGTDTTITIAGSPGVLNPSVVSFGQAGHPDAPDKNLTFSPTTPLEGQLWFNQTKQELYVYLGTGSPITFQWKSLGLLQFVLDNYYNKNYIDILETDLRQAINQAAPAGSVKEYAGSSAPSGWLLCDGNEYDPGAEANLFAIIGTTYNTGAETPGWFRVPDMRGRVPVGINPLSAGPNAGTGVKLHPSIQTLGGNDGTESHILSVNEIPLHDHSVSLSTVANHTHTGNTNTTGLHSHSGTTGAGGSHNHGLSWSSAESGGGDNEIISWNGNQNGVTSTVGNHTHNFTGMSQNGNHLHNFTTAAAGGHSHIVSELSVGAGVTHENTQPFLTLNFIIKT